MLEDLLEPACERRVEARVRQKRGRRRTCPRQGWPAECDPEERAGCSGKQPPAVERAACAGKQPPAVERAAREAVRGRAAVIVTHRSILSARRSSRATRGREH